MPEALSQDQEAEAIEIELELRRRKASPASAVVKPAASRPAAEPDLKAQWAKSDWKQRAMMLINNFGKTAGEKYGGAVDEGINMVIEGGGPALGQSLGGMTGPLAPVAVPLLGAVGGAGSSAAAQSRRGEPITLGRTISSAIIGAIPGSPLAGAGARKVALEAGKYAAGNVAGAIAESEIDRGELPSVRDIVTQAATGAVAAPAARLFSKARIPTDQERVFARRNAVFEGLRGDGVVVPPHELGKGPMIVANAAGKAALHQQAAIRNQVAWQRLVREEIGLPKTPDPISVRDLEMVRDVASEPYRTLQTISTEAKQQLEERMAQLAQNPDPHAAMIAMEEPAMKQSLTMLRDLAAADVDALKAARKSAQDSYRAFKNGSPEAYDAWQAATNTAEGLENAIDRAAEILKDDTLLSRLRESRKKIAQTYSIEDSLNLGTGLVNPIEFGRILDRRGEKALTGNLKKIGDFALAFHREAVEASRVPAPGVGNLGMLAATSNATRGDLPGFTGAVINLTMGRPSRAFLLSDRLPFGMQGMQDSMLNPVERQNFKASLARFITQNAANAKREAITASDEPRR